MDRSLVFATNLQELMDVEELAKEYEQMKAQHQQASAPAVGGQKKPALKSK